MLPIITRATKVNDLRTNLAKVAEGAVFLLSLAGIALHDEITGHFNQGLLRSSNLFLSLPLLLSFLTLALITRRWKKKNNRENR